MLGIRGEAFAAGPEELQGSLPATGGISIAVWSGGPVARLRAAALERGCGVASIWVESNGDLVGYVPGAPTVVNQAFTAKYKLGGFPTPTPVLPVGTALVLICQASTGPARVNGMPSTVSFTIDTGVSASDEAVIRSGSAMAEDYLRNVYGDGLSALDSIKVHADAAGAAITGAGVQATSCCTTNVGTVNYSTTHADWIAAGTFVQPFGFDPRVAVPAHEYFHLWQIEVGCINTQVPSWMTEGMAEYLSFQAVQRRGGLISDDQRRRYEYYGASGVPSSATLQSMETRTGMFKHAGSYSLANLGFQQLLKSQRAEAMREFCVDVAGGKAWQASFAARFGQAPETFYSTFEATRSTFK